MCVIIYRKPGITIPYDKLKSACYVNADGMGIVTIDRGKMHLRKYFWDDGNDPDVLAKALEDNISCDSYIHLRFRTKGATDSSNVHPFGVLKEKKHGMDLQFMHNGTIPDFGTDADCDSKDFVKKILSPLSERLLRGMDKEELVNDPIYTALLQKYAGKGSVFLLADNFGNHNIINMDNGKQFEGWWTSNEYSFNRYHREPDYTSARYYRDMDWETGKVQAETKKPTVVALPPSKPEGDSKPPFNDDIPFETENKGPVIPKRETFIEMAGLTSLADVCQLTNLQVQDLVEEAPEMASLLILDLLKELYDRDNEYDDRADYERSVA